MKNSYAGKILYVDLTDGKIKRIDLDRNIAHLFLGGKGYGSKILCDSLEPRVHPFSRDNIIVYSMPYS